MADDDGRSRQIVIAGGGIAGLTAALAFARRGFPVRLFERAERPQEVGAGLQLSPNATGILDRLGVLDRLRPVATMPDAIVLRDSFDLREIGRVALGASAARRWKSPYLVLHRADLHGALWAAAQHEPEIEIVTGAAVRDAAFHAQGLTVSVDREGRIAETPAGLLVVADGVWSANCRLAGMPEKSAFSGRIAWRATLRADAAAGATALLDPERVTVFLHPKAHLVAYPVRGGAAFNLAGFARGAAPDVWSSSGDAGQLQRAFAGADARLPALLEQAGHWTIWPIHMVPPGQSTVDRKGVAVIGDAAHAMTPFAAQGAAMAIEDAWMLATHVAAQPKALAAALQRYEAERRPRIAAVARRGRLNEFTWHAWGPAAWGRNLFLRWRGPERLAADMNWLYGWTPPDSR